MGRPKKEHISTSQRQYRLERILEMIEDDRSVQYIARIFGISRQAVTKIIKVHEEKQAEITNDK